MTSLQDQMRVKYDSYTITPPLITYWLITEGQESERSFDVWASQAEIEAFARDGYLVREALIEGEPLEMLRRALDEVEEAEFEEADGSRLRGRDWIPRHLFDKHADFHMLINFDPLLSLARALLGPFVRIRQLAARISYPGQPVQFTRWHHHQPGHDRAGAALFRGSAQAGLSDLSVDELNDANGLLAVVPGTHLHDGEELPLEEHGNLAGQGELRAPAGSCVMLHGNLWHRAMPTGEEGKKRRVLILSYGPTWMRSSPFANRPENGLLDGVIEGADPADAGVVGYWRVSVSGSRGAVTMSRLPPIHPGEILYQEFLLPLDITPSRLAKSIGVDTRRIHGIVRAQRSITAETALLFSRYFGNSAEFWMGLQNQYDLETAEDRLSQKLDMVVAHSSRE